MAFREKLAWLGLVTMLIAYTLYFGWVLSWPDPDRMRPFDILWPFGLIAGGHGIAYIIGSIAIAVTATADANQAADERDRAIARRGATIGYYILLVGMLLVGVVMPFTDARVEIVNTALFAIVVAEITRSIVVVISYRRGWHG